MKRCVQQCNKCGKFVGQNLVTAAAAASATNGGDHGTANGNGNHKEVMFDLGDCEHSGSAHFDCENGLWFASLAAEIATPPSSSSQRQRQYGRNQNGGQNGSPQSPSKMDATNCTAIAYVSDETLSCMGLSEGHFVSLDDKMVARIVSLPSLEPFHICLSPKVLQSYFIAQRLIKVTRVRSEQIVETSTVHLIPQMNMTSGDAATAAKGDNTTDASKREILEAISQVSKTCLSVNFFHNNQPLFLSTPSITMNVNVRVPSANANFAPAGNGVTNGTSNYDSDFLNGNTIEKMSSLSLSPSPGTPKTPLSSGGRDDAQRQQLAYCSQSVYKLSRDKEARVVIRDNSILDPDLPAGTFYSLCGPKLYDQLMQFFKAQVCSSSDLMRMGFRPPRGLLLHGSPGTGKTSLCAFLADLADTHAVLVTADRVFTRFYGDSEAALRALFDNAIKCAPSTIIIDDIDVFCSKGEAERKLIACLCSLLDMIHRLPANIRIFVLAATSKLDSVDVALRRYGRLDHELELTAPDIPSRRALFTQLLSRADHLLSLSDFESLAEMTSSFVAADIRALCTEAALHCSLKNYNAKINNNNGNDLAAMNSSLYEDNNAKSACQLSFGDFLAVFPRVRPTARRDICVEVAHVKWHDIGGMDDVKNRLRQCVEWPLKHASALTRLGLKPPKGALLYGPPGCSKTLIARALATESGLAFLSIKGPELFNKWLGESERAVRQLFRRARQASPSIIFFDEVDAIAPVRSGGPSGGASSSSSTSSASERVVAQLLTELDGIQELDRVFVLAATNRPDVLDTALLRPGRLDRLIYVGLPDDATRRQILMLQFARTPVKSAHGSQLHSIVEHLAARTEGFTGAEVVSLVQEAAFHALDRSEFGAVDVRESDFDHALSILRPRTDTRLLHAYESFSLAH